MIPLAITAAIQNACRRRNTGTSHSRGTLWAIQEARRFSLFDFHRKE